MHTLLAHIIFHYISFTILLHISVTFFNSYFDSPESESTVHHPQQWVIPAFAVIASRINLMFGSIAVDAETCSGYGRVLRLTQ